MNMIKRLFQKKYKEGPYVTDVYSTRNVLIAAKIELECARNQFDWAEDFDEITLAIMRLRYAEERYDNLISTHRVLNI